MSALTVEPMVLAVCSDAGHNFSKPMKDHITLVAGLGVEGDAHYGKTVQHLFDMRKDASKPNLRQVHLMHAELFDDLAAKDITVNPGEMGENITTSGLDILSLPRGTLLRFSAGAEIQITGLRNPCSKLNAIHPELMEATLDRTRRAGKRPFPLSGVMAIITQSGDVRPGDKIEVVMPKPPFEALVGV
jgi:hypothetical protein